MARPNYSKVSTSKIESKNNKDTIFEKENVPVEETMEIKEINLIRESTGTEEINTEKETVTEPKIIGIVSDCTRLNVRANPSKLAEVLMVINSGKEVEILPSPNGSWYSVIVDGIKGYCMKRFIKNKSQEV